MLLSKIRTQSKSIMWLFAVFFGASIFYFGYSGLVGLKDKFGGKEQAGDVRYTVEINGEKISAEMFNYRYLKLAEMLKMRYAQQGMPLPETYETTMAIKAQVVDSLQREELLVKEAEQRKVVVSDQELDKVLDDERNRMVGSREKPKDAGLPSRVSNMMEENKKTKQFRDGLRSQGIEYGDYKEIIRRSLLAQKMGQTISQEMGMQESKRVQEKAMGVWKKLQSEDFSAVARQYSEDEVTAQAGGAMGAKTRAELDPALSERAFNMKPGTFSEPIKTQEGFQIIKVINREEASGEEFNKQQDAIRAQLMKEKGANATVTQRDIERAYEKVYLQRILFKLKGEGDLVEEWVKKKKAEKNFTIKVLDPELDAFMKYRDINPAAKNAQAELDKVIALYTDLVKSRQTNENLYMMMGTLYEEKNRLLNEELDKKAGEKDTLDPYAAPEEEGKALKTEKYLKEALESYKQGYSIAEQNQKPNVNAMMGIGRVSYQLSRSGGKDERKLRAQARKAYNEAIDFAYDDGGMKLGIIKDALSKLKDEKGLKRVNAAIAEMQAQMMAPEGEGGAVQVPVEAPKEEQPEAGNEQAPAEGTPVEKTEPKAIDEGKPVSAEPAKAGENAAAPAAAKPAAKPATPAKPATESKPAEPKTR